MCYIWDNLIHIYKILAIFKYVFFLIGAHRLHLKEHQSINQVTGWPTNHKLQIGIFSIYLPFLKNTFTRHLLVFVWSLDNRKILVITKWFFFRISRNQCHKFTFNLFNIWIIFNILNIFDIIFKLVILVTRWLHLLKVLRALHPLLGSLML